MTGKLDAGRLALVAAKKRRARSKPSPLSVKLIEDAPQPAGPPGYVPSPAHMTLARAGDGYTGGVVELSRQLVADLALVIPRGAVWLSPAARVALQAYADALAKEHAEHVTVQLLFVSNFAALGEIDAAEALRRARFHRGEASWCGPDKRLVTEATITKALRKKPGPKKTAAGGVYALLAWDSVAIVQPTRRLDKRAGRNETEATIERFQKLWAKYGQPKKH
jgi:hypothetical protein